jgi:hypothetical protein
MYYHSPYNSQAIAEWYCSQPETGSEYAKSLWQRFIPIGYQQASRLLALPRYKGLTLIYEKGQRYKTASEMINDIRDNHQLAISSDNTRHPIFSHDDTMVGRVWHDLAHDLAYEQGADFTYQGEVKVYQEQLRHVMYKPNFAELRHALFVDVLGQAAVTIEGGYFPIQKIF